MCIHSSISSDPITFFICASYMVIGQFQLSLIWVIGQGPIIYSIKYKNLPTSSLRGGLEGLGVNTLSRHFPSMLF